MIKLIAILVVTFAPPLVAQWLNYPDARTPRTKDGKPNLISFQFENGVYIAPKIIDAGYLAIGKKKLPFARRAAGN